MEHLEKSIECDVSVHAAYNQWTQFDSFPEFMKGITRVHQLDANTLHWEAEVGGKKKEWTAKIQDQVPNQRISWRSASGAENSGTVTFQDLGGDQCKVTLRLEYDPQGFVENVGDALGVVDTRVGGDLERFKKFIESRGTETGALGAARYTAAR